MSFTFNGISSKKIGIATKMNTENRMPDLRNLTDTLVGHHGILDLGQTLSERKIEIDCFIPPGKNSVELLELKDQIVAWLNPEQGLCPLILDSEPDRKYLARLENGISFERMVRNTSTFKLSFFCPDPFAYAMPDESYTLRKSADIVRKFGNYNSAPRYEIYGQLINETQSIRITVNEEIIEICGTLALNDTFIIDVDDLTAKIVSSYGTEKNALGQMKKLEFPYLKMGKNTITIGTSGGGSLERLKINARSRWL